MKEQLKEKKTENQVAFIPNSMLIYTVAAGIGLFLVLAFLRILYGSACPRCLLCCIACCTSLCRNVK
ncbi:MAG TPA: DUF1538 family protein [Candidatus Merdibacter merdipullorum]|nr:DUF1538 family protein [Candidatus Merdibacter merdipullorum]